MKICICASISFYDKFTLLKSELDNLGHVVYIPSISFKSKTEAMKDHFQKIDESDCILVSNYEKNGIKNYIGGNVFLEMGYAFGGGKKTLF